MTHRPVRHRQATQRMPVHAPYPRQGVDALQAEGLGLGAVAVV